MAEYINVEQPFLAKLKEIGWQTIDQGQGIPQDPSKSLRTSFKEVALKNEFKRAVKAINLTKDGKQWLTDKQLEDIWFEVTNTLGRELPEANKEISNLILKGTRVNKNELTGEQNPLVRLVDFKNYKANFFVAINQFRIITPGRPRDGIIPDIVCFVNGLPWIVIECKDFEVAEPLSESYIQIKRYANSRSEDPYAIKEGEERLFYYNLFSVITHGTEARFGSISADFDYYYNWVDIFPEEYRVIEYPPNEERQEVLIHGMFNKEILLDVFKNFTVFETEKGKEIKKICRYQQYRAVGKMIRSLREGNSGRERSGVIWHTQGSGKSLTMVFLIKKIRSCANLKDFKIIMVVDRIDLEDQLSNTANLSGEPVRIVNRRRDLQELSDDTSDLNMVMIHKFLDTTQVSAQSLVDAGIVPRFEPFEPINDSDRILILIDEAHRTQGGDMGDNLFTAFKNATRFGFTGTPLLTERHKTKTHERFGPFIDFYKMNDAVKDRATVNIIYIGKTSDDKLKNKEAFDEEFEDVFRQRTEEERLEIQKRYGTFIAYLESKERVARIAKDIIDHYSSEILPNGFKAQVVGSSIIAAARYKYELENAINQKIADEKNKSENEQDKTLIERLEFLKVATVVSKTENNELSYVSSARREAIETNAIENFKKDFDFTKDNGQYTKPETGIGILCVCDRLLTGFDAPVEQVMYLDKNLREHDLLQAIARVNRPQKHKKHGIVVDYFGITKNLKEALAIYTDSDEKEMQDFLDYFRDINKEIPVLEARYKRLLDLFTDYKIPAMEAFLAQKINDQKKEFEIAEKCVAEAENVKFRAELDTYTKSFFDSLDLLFNQPEIQAEYWVPAKRLGYLLWRIRNRYKDDTLDLKWASSKVRNLIDKHLESLGITERIAQVSLLSDEFPKVINDLNRTPKSKASEMEHAIRWHIKVNLSKDPAMYTRFKDRLENIIKNYEGNWETIVSELTSLRADMSKGRQEKNSDIPVVQAPFFDILAENAKGKGNKEFDREKIKGINNSIFEQILEGIQITNIWDKKAELRALEATIEDELNYSGIPELAKKHEYLAKELLKVARNREVELKRYITD
jgi:type I restriction enzyme, R subunit